MIPRELDDVVLLEAWQRGDKHAGTELVHRYDAFIRRFLHQRVAGGVDDLVQDVWVVIARCSDRFERRASFRSYLLGVARNKAREARRGLARARLHVSVESVALIDERVDPSVDLERRLLAAAIDDAAARLPAHVREILRLYYVDRLRARQVGMRLGVVENTARSRVRRATERLQQAMQHGARSASR